MSEEQRKEQIKRGHRRISPALWPSLATLRHIRGFDLAYLPTNPEEPGVARLAVWSIGFKPSQNYTTTGYPSSRPGDAFLGTLCASANDQGGYFDKVRMGYGYMGCGYMGYVWLHKV